MKKRQAAGRDGGVQVGFQSFDLTGQTDLEERREGKIKDSGEGETSGKVRSRRFQNMGCREEKEKYIW